MAHHIAETARRAASHQEAYDRTFDLLGRSGASHLIHHKPRLALVSC